MIKIKIESWYEIQIEKLKLDKNINEFVDIFTKRRQCFQFLQFLFPVNLLFHLKCNKSIWIFIILEKFKNEKKC